MLLIGVFVVPPGSMLSWFNCCHSCGEYWDASVSSPALVSGNLIHCMFSVSQRWRMMAWSGGMAELGGVAMYHVGGM